MSKLLALGVTATAALVLGMAALAQDLPEARPAPTGGGRTIARGEVPDLVTQGFQMLDTNGDGAIDRGEYDAFRAMRRAAMMARRGGGGGAGGFLLGPRWFEAADANGDGRVTPAEAQAAALAQFDRADTDHDGTLTPDERHAAMAAMRGGRATR